MKIINAFTIFNRLGILIYDVAVKESSQELQTAMVPFGNPSSDRQKAMVDKGQHRILTVRYVDVIETKEIPACADVTI